jgi:hypothetical protein
LKKKDFFSSINRQEKNRNRERKIHNEGGILGLKRDDRAKKKPNPKTISFKPVGGSPRGPKQKQQKPCPFLGQDPAPLHSST